MPRGQQTDAELIGSAPKLPPPGAEAPNRPKSVALGQGGGTLQDMGWDARNFLPPTTRERDVHELLQGLGYEKDTSGALQNAWYLPPKEEFFSGVIAFVSRTTEKLLIDTHTSIWAGRADRDIHNNTIRLLKRRFGGGFRSDFGGNAYLRYERPDRRGAEAACYRAYAAFEDNMTNARVWADGLAVGPGIPWETPVLQDLAMNPLVGLNHLMLPFLASVFEEFVKSCYVGLLRYSDRRLSVFKAARSLPAEDWIRIADRETTVEEAHARWLSFQNLDRVAAQFRDLDPRLDVAGVLRRPYRRRRRSLYESIAAVLERRHRFVHELEVDSRYDNTARERDFSDMAIGVERIYRHLLDRYGWAPYDL